VKSALAATAAHLVNLELCMSMFLLLCVVLWKPPEVGTKFQWFSNSSGFQIPVVSKYPWFPNSSGFLIPVVSWKALEFRNHWNSETTGIRKPLDFGSRWNQETIGIWKPLDFGNHWNLETTGIGNGWNLENTGIWKPLDHWSRAKIKRGRRCAPRRGIQLTKRGYA